VNLPPGWALLPLWHVQADSCACPAGVECSSPAKHPRTRHGLLDASHDPDVVGRWRRQYPRANWGATTGRTFDVVDVDADHGGVDSLTEAADGRPLGWGPIVETGGGGRHYYCAVTGSRNRAGLLPGVDYRGRGGFVVIPDSLHASGRRYRWLVGPGEPLRPLPGWLHELVIPPPPPRSEPRFDRVPSRRRSYGQAALDAEAALVVGSVEGKRNHQLNKSSFAVGQLVGAGWLGAADAIETLLDAAISCGLTEAEACATIDSGLRAGIARPRGGPHGTT
jgi:hypothetical protein